MSRIFLPIALIVTAATLTFAQENFSRRLTSDERKAAGMDLLSREQIAVLDALVQRDRQRPSTPIAVPAAPVAPQEAPALTRTAPQPAGPRPEQTSRLFGLPAKDEGKMISGTLVGEYRGWTGNTTFRLEDGQVWVQTDHNDSHTVTPRQNPRVKIETAVFGDYKLTVEGSSLWVRVRRLQ